MSKYENDSVSIESLPDGMVRLTAHGIPRVLTESAVTTLVMALVSAHQDGEISFAKQMKSQLSA